MPARSAPVGNSGEQKLPATCDPTYVRGRNRSEWVAHFRSGTTVQVELGRRRRYPGLAGPAPLTHACYRKFVEFGLNAHHVLDVGCGTGTGIRWLLQTHSRLTGLDIDGTAVAFAHEYVPEIELIHADVQSRRVMFSGDAALIVDVLGLVPDPVQVLRSVAFHAPKLETVFVAEPLASRDQALVPPARRAFGFASMRSLFSRCGFSLDECATVDNGMLCAIGHPTREPAVARLIEAERAYLSHRTQPFLETCRLINASGCVDLRVEAALLEARLWFDLNQLDRAIAILTGASALAPRDPRPVAGLSRLALAAENQEQAIHLAKAALLIDDTDFSAACSAALAYAGVEDKSSLEAWRVANALAPFEASIARLLCATALSEGQHEDGLAILERLGQYQQNFTELDEHVGLRALTAAAASKCGHRS